MAGLNKYQAYPEYRDSGVAWLGEIPRTWQAYTGKRLFSSVRTPALSNDEQLAASQKYGVIPQTLMMQLNDSKVMLALKGTDSFRHVEKNNFVISLRSFEGGIEHSNYQGCVSPAYTVLKSVNDISFSFYRYLLKSEPYISALQASTDSLRDGKSINYEQFGAITLPSPSLPEQSIIAHFLDHETAKIDNLIEKQQQLIELLKEKRQAVISHAVTKGLNPDVPMKDSVVEWLEEIPSSWKVVPTYSVCKSTTVKNYNGLEKNILSLSYGKIIRRNVESNFGLLPESFDTYQIINKGDIILRLTDLQNDKNSLRVGLVKERGIITSAYLKIVSASCLISSYLYYLFYSYDITKVFYGMGGGLRQSMKFEDFRRLPLLIPSKEEQSAIVKQLDQLTAKIDTLIDKQLYQIALLKERRTALISAAVTGKIDLRNWSAPIPEAETPMEASA
ncbi:TPA: restriction endonuclease subunit S [Escherichia coli]|nr:restriction endonuclease subunit S [Escherichia coli]HCQ0748215.1 restriction endonuclease subunit S [Escherichia coli]